MIDYNKLWEEYRKGPPLVSIPREDRKPRKQKRDTRQRSSGNG